MGRPPRQKYYHARTDPVHHVAVTTASLLPLIVLWTWPRPWLLITAAGVMGLVTVFGVWMLSVSPLGTPILFTAALWYGAAWLRWTLLRDDPVAD